MKPLRLLYQGIKTMEKVSLNPAVPSYKLFNLRLVIISISFVNKVVFW